MAKKLSERKSFILYHDKCRRWESNFNDSELGALFRAIIQYECNGVVPDFPKGSGLRISFGEAKDALDTNDRSYKEKVIKRIKSAYISHGETEAQAEAHFVRDYGCVGDVLQMHADAAVTGTVSVESNSASVSYSDSQSENECNVEELSARDMILSRLKANPLIAGQLQGLDID